jgi:hypothetical protein
MKQTARRSNRRAVFVRAFSYLVIASEAKQSGRIPDAVIWIASSLCSSQRRSYRRSAALAPSRCFTETSIEPALFPQRLNDRWGVTSTDINFGWRMRWPKDKGVVMVPAG